METTLGIGVNEELIPASAASFAGARRIRSAVDSRRGADRQNLTI
jgi:hypothetical protein